LAMLRASHVIYLSAIIKALENMMYSREIALEHMLKTDKSSNQISTFEFNFNKDTENLKKRSIKMLIAHHPSFFRSMLQFDDWSSAMVYLSEHKEEALNFWERNHDR
jgi:hypothetical protein